MDKQKLLEEVELFVLDMDGTFYLGDRILDGSLAFLDRVKATGRRFLFFTNNSSKSPQAYVQKLAALGCPIGLSDIMTSGDVTIQYLKSHYPDAKVYLVGTPVLEESFGQKGIRLVEEAPDVVVIGFDTTLTYHKLERACTFLRGGAVFLATHLDINCPTEDGFIPDCGSICALISRSVDRQPKYLGKPFSETVDMILKTTGAKRERTAFVGDRLYTDVATGVRGGAKGLLVLSGETKLEDVAGPEVPPDGIFASLGEMAGYL